MTDNANPDAEPDSRGGKEAHILSCERCARRKIKCDRSGDGCLNCKKAGVPCHVVARPRLPRGRRTRPSKVNSDLKARLLRLENLVNSYAQHGDGSDASQTSSSPQAGVVSTDDSSQSNAPKGVSRYVGSQFWTGLSQEIFEVREALESSEDEEDARRESHVYTDAGIVPDAETVLFGSPRDAQNIPDLDASDVPMTCALCEIFLYRFHPMIKVGHGPSIRALMCGQQYLDYPPGHIACKLMTFTVCYGAIETLRDGECRQRFGVSKASLRQKYKTATEIYLSRAELLTTTDMTVLEAFAIYVVALRAGDSSRKAWTLVATAVRIAEAMGLHLDDSQLSLRPFHREMRRRLWQHLRILDTRAAYDRGTEKMIPFDMPPVPLPLNINDADFSFETEEPLQEREGYTDMTHTLLILVGSERNFSATGGFRTGEENSAQSKEERIAWYREVEKKYLRHCDMRVDLQWFTRQVASTMAATSLLFSARPLRRGARVDGDLSSDSILLLAIDVLEKATISKIDPRGAAWDWLTFVPWHSLAVAVAELVVRPSGPVVDKAWPIVEAAFAQYSPRVADSDRGMLWRPLIKLMSKARKTRALHLLQSGQLVEMPKSPQWSKSPQTEPQQGSVDSKSQCFEPSLVTNNQQFEPMDMSSNIMSNLGDEGGVDWFQSFINQGAIPTDGTSVGWDQWDAFISNIESAPNAAGTYAGDQAPWVGIDSTAENLSSTSQQQPRTQASNVWLGTNGILPDVYM